MTLSILLLYMMGGTLSVASGRHLGIYCRAYAVCAMWFIETITYPDLGIYVPISFFIDVLFSGGSSGGS